MESFDIETPPVHNDPWHLEAEDVLKSLDVNIVDGLDERRVHDRLLSFGKNELPEAPEVSMLTLVMKQFEDLMVVILLIAAFVSFILAMFEEHDNDRVSAFMEPVVILLILVLNAVVGVVQEKHAERAILALKKFEAHSATVIRDSRKQEVHACDLVPGDMIVVRTGDRIPADARLVKLSCSVFAVDQSILTGEGGSCFKDATMVCHTLQNTMNQDKKNMLFAGTMVMKGSATAVVTATGPATEIGRIHDTISNVEEEKTPLKQKLDEFGEQLSKLIGVVCVAVWVINFAHFDDPIHGGFVKGAIYYFKIAVALAVAAVPEGLPAVVTTCLALGTRVMAKEGAIVRSLPSVETLGCTSVICVDKTGTLTTNQMVVKKILCLDRAKRVEYFVEGEDYSPFGRVFLDGGRTMESPVENDRLRCISRVADLCNEAEIVFDRDSGKHKRVGEPTEAALKALALKLLVSDPSGHSTQGWNSHYEVSRVLEFSRERKMMTVVCKDATESFALAKGAPESIVDRCTSVMLENGNVESIGSLQSTLLEEVHQLSLDGYRCMAVAQRTLLANVQHEPEDIERSLTFLGFLAIMDPPRHQVADALEECALAGIRTVMVTGDSEATAFAVAKQVGLVDESDTHTSLREEGVIVNGSEWNSFDDVQQFNVARKMKIMARVEPVHKLRLVQLLRKAGEVVAMTGDGVNDAPALKQADIGVAMGSGMAVAREASDLVLADDNYATIVVAVKQGRTIFSNTKQFIRYLISSNIGEVACIFLSAALGIPEGLIPVQLLWVNLVTDGLPATALGFNPPDPDSMCRPPRSRAEGIVNRWLAIRFGIIGFYVGLAVVLGFVWWFLYFDDGPKISWEQLRTFEACEEPVALANGYSCEIFKWDGDFGLKGASTMSLSILVVIEMLNALNSLSENESLLRIHPWSNMWLLGAIAISVGLHLCILHVPVLAKIFCVVPLSWGEWAAVVWFSLPVLLLDELLKFFTKALHKRSGVSVQYMPSMFRTMNFKEV